SSPFAPHRLPLLVQRGLAMPTTAHFRAVRQNRVANARVLAAARANDHHVGGVDAPFLLDDPALYVLRRVGTRVALDDAHMLHNHGILLAVDPKNPPALSSVLAGDHFDVVALADLHVRSEEHTSELQSRFDLVCRLLLE